MSNQTLPRRPRMTAEAATSFSGYSTASMLQIGMAISSRAEQGIYTECACEPYADTFTFARWLAQGFAVRKGEKAKSRFVSRRLRLLANVLRKIQTRHRRYAYDLARRFCSVAVR